MTTPNDPEQRPRWQVIGLAALVALLTGVAIYFVFAGNGDQEPTKPTETPVIQSQQPSKAPEATEPAPQSESPQEQQPTSDTPEDTGTDNKAANTAAKNFMDAMNKGGDGNALAARVSNMASSAFLASLKPVPASAIPPIGHKVTVTDSGAENQYVATVTAEDGGELYSFLLAPYKVNGKQVFLVNAMTFLDDGSHAQKDKNGEFVRVDVMPLSPDGNISMQRSAISAMRNYVEYDGNEDAKTREARARAAVNGGAIPPLRPGNWGTETRERMFQPTNIRILNQSSGEATDSNTISVYMSVQSANLRASEEANDSFNGVVDFKWDAGLKQWVAKGIRIV